MKSKFTTALTVVVTVALILGISVFSTGLPIRLIGDVSRSESSQSSGSASEVVASNLWGKSVDGTSVSPTDWMASQSSVPTARRTTAEPDDTRALPTNTPRNEKPQVYKKPSAKALYTQLWEVYPNIGIYPDNDMSETSEAIYLSGVAVGSLGQQLMDNVGDYVGYNDALLFGALAENVYDMPADVGNAVWNAEGITLINSALLDSAAYGGQTRLEYYLFDVAVNSGSSAGYGYILMAMYSESEGGEYGCAALCDWQLYSDNITNDGGNNTEEYTPVPTYSRLWEIYPQINAAPNDDLTEVNAATFINGIAVGSLGQQMMEYSGVNDGDGLFLVLRDYLYDTSADVDNAVWNAEGITLINSALFNSAAYGDQTRLEYYLFDVAVNSGSSAGYGYILMAMYSESEGGEGCVAALCDWQLYEDGEGGIDSVPPTYDGLGTVEYPFDSPESYAFWEMYPGYTPFDGDIYSISYHRDGWTVGTYIFSAGCREYIVWNCNEYVSLRAEADANTSAVAHVYLGDTVLVNGTYGEWSLCYFNDRYGWIKSKYLYWAEEEPPISEDEESDQYVDNNTYVNYATLYVYGESGDSNFRTEPSLSGEDIGTLHVGEYAAYLYQNAVDDRGIVWYLCSMNGMNGWISSRYTVLIDG